MREVELRAPAKVNLFLRVLNRERRTEYHALETLLCGLELADGIRMRRHGGAGVTLSVEGPWDLGPDPRNLAVRAARAFARRAGIGEPDVEIRLAKRIPPGSGLGGGSSDAAAVLRGMNRLFDMPLAEHELLRVGAGLGSDVPFFLSPSPLGLAWSRGQRLLSLPPLPAAPVLVAIPDEPSSTPEAYRRLARARDEGGVEGSPEPWVYTPDDLGSWRGVADVAVNDFESVVLEGRTELRNLLARLREWGPGPSLLSGSGSAVFAVFRSRDRAQRRRTELAAEHRKCAVRLTSTLEEWPPARSSRS